MPKRDSAGAEAEGEGIAVTCQDCGFIHGSNGACLDVVKLALARLVAAVGMPGECKGCQASIFWVRHINGKSVPYTTAGENHFINCPNAKDFKR